jgi:glycosyltransferase involved in cell wall biosynthesis
MHIDDLNAPFVSIFMAVRNENKTIERCLSSFMEQTYRHDKFELVIADKSDDDTDSILNKYASQYPDQIKILQNHTGRTVDGLNLALAHCRGDIVVLYIGHAYPEKEFIKNIVAALHCTDIDMVGGKVVPESLTDSIPSKAIALALRHPYTIGKNSFTLQKRSPSKSMHWMAVKKELVDKIGSFNPRYSPRGEDIDWYERLIAAGGKAVFEPSIVSHYYVRDTFYKQFFIQLKNGYYRMLTFLDARRGMRARHLLPVILLFLIICFSIVIKNIIPISLLLFCYLFTSIAISFFIAKGKIRYVPSIMWAILSIHAGHIIGITAGAFRFGPQLLGNRVAHCIVAALKNQRAR